MELKLIFPSGARKRKRKKSEVGRRAARKGKVEPCLRCSYVLRFTFHVSPFTFYVLPSPFFHSQRRYTCALTCTGSQHGGRTHPRRHQFHPPDRAKRPGVRETRRSGRHALSAGDRKSTRLNSSHPSISY